MVSYAFIQLPHYTFLNFLDVINLYDVVQIIPVDMVPQSSDNETISPDSVTVKTMALPAWVAAEGLCKNVPVKVYIWLIFRHVIW